MDDSRIDDLLAQLRSHDAQLAWTVFLERYSPVLLKVVRLFERDEDAVGDCYLFVCEQLSRHRFRRLLRFRCDGPARFTTWLCAVTRNLCLDWRRREVGRHRVFAPVGRLSALDQQIFRCLFVEHVPVEEAFLRLKPAFPQLTVDQVSDAAVRIERALSPRQRWLLVARRGRAAMSDSAAVGQDGEMAWDPPSEMPTPEAWVAFQEERDALSAAISRLPPRDRLLVRLRFQHDLTFAEIARLLQLQNAQAADRRVREAVDKLRAAMSGRGKP